jgi:hypothetical protein
MNLGNLVNPIRLMNRARTERNRRHGSGLCYKTGVIPSSQAESYRFCRQAIAFIAADNRLL